VDRWCLDHEMCGEDAYCGLNSEFG
jgi:hypothetical protein